MDRLAEIKKLYFATTRATIARDFDRAVTLLKDMGSEEERERATAFMDGLSQMRSEWAAAARPGPGASGAKPTAKAKPRPGRT